LTCCLPTGAGNDPLGTVTMLASSSAPVAQLSASISLRAFTPVWCCIATSLMPAPIVCLRHGEAYKF